jgi:hypothetical protein
LAESCRARLSDTHQSDSPGRYGKSAGAATPFDAGREEEFP